jgi:hypothetical protein
MDGHTLAAPSDISAGPRVARLGEVYVAYGASDGCGEWDTWVYGGANQAGAEGAGRAGSHGDVTSWWLSYHSHAM